MCVRGHSVKDRGQVMSPTNIPAAVLQPEPGKALNWLLEEMSQPEYGLFMESCQLPLAVGRGPGAGAVHAGFAINRD